MVNHNDSQQLRPVSKPTQMPSRPSTPQLLPKAVEMRPIIGEALTRLCSLKNQAQFTAHQLETWLAALSIFPPGIVNRALLEIALSVDPFPDCGKVVAKCQIEMHKKSTVPTQADPSKPTKGTVDRVAKAFGIQLD